MGPLGCQPPVQVLPPPGRLPVFWSPGGPLLSWLVPLGHQRCSQHIANVVQRPVDRAAGDPGPPLPFPNSLVAPG